MTGRSATRRALAAAVVAGTLPALTACGGEDQAADESSGTYRVEVVRATFPERQRLAEDARFVVVVRNTGREAVPNVAVTLDGFSAISENPDLADRDRPLWIVDDGPAGGTTAYVNTWALGRLPPGATRRFVWRVTATTAGEHRLRWRVAAGLHGKAQAVTGSDDRAPEGEVTVRVDPVPAASRVDPATGEVEPAS